MNTIVIYTLLILAFCVVIVMLVELIQEVLSWWRERKRTGAGKLFLLLPLIFLIGCSDYPVRRVKIEKVEVHRRTSGWNNDYWSAVGRTASGEWATFTSSYLLVTGMEVCLERIGLSEFGSYDRIIPCPESHQEKVQ